MKAIVLDGMAVGTESRRIEKAVAGQLADSGCQIESFAAREMKMAPCTGCFGCWTKTPGICVQHDDAVRPGRLARPYRDRRAGGRPTVA